MSIDKYLHLIKKSYSNCHAEEFLNSCLYNNQMEVLQKSCQEVLQMIPPQPFECALLSACLVEHARQIGFSCYLVAGSLTFNKRILFDYDPIMSVSRNDWGAFDG